MKTPATTPFLQCLSVACIFCVAFFAKAKSYGSIVPYTNDTYTVLLDHFDGGTSANILAYAGYGGPCGPAWPSATPSYSFGAGPSGLNHALALYPPPGGYPISASYLKYTGGELLCQTNGTIECWIYLTNYLFSIHQFTYSGECEGDVGGLLVNSSGQLVADVWYTQFDTFSFNSGTNIVPLNTWTHVALSWGSTGARLYINGMLVGTNSNTGSFTHWPFGSNSVYCMSSSGATSGGDGGSIDELRISSIQRTNFNLPVNPPPFWQNFIDFESLPDGSKPTEGMEITNQFASSAGVTFSLQNGKAPRLAKRDGANFLAFWGPPSSSVSNHPAANQNLGDFFLTGHGGYTANPSPLTIWYTQPVAAASGAIIDIDAHDAWEIVARDSQMNGIATNYLTGASPNAGDGKAVWWSFSRTNADICSIRIAYVGTSSPVGWAFDNFAPGLAMAPANLSMTMTQQVPQIGIGGTFGDSYRVDYADSLSSPNWQSLTNVILTNAPLQFLLDSPPLNTGMRFYRAVGLSQ